MRSPRPAQVDLFGAGPRSEAAVIENISATLSFVALALRRDKHGGVRQAVDLASIEKRQSISENEVDVAFDVTVREILACRPAWTLLGIAALSVRVERVLIAPKTDTPEYRAIASDAQRDSLRALAS